jgi:hypothetical protein
VTVQVFVLSSTAVMRYDAGGPPEPAPWATVTVTWALPATAVGVAGVSGTGGCGVTAFETPDATDVPPTLLAVAVKV